MLYESGWEVHLRQSSRSSTQTGKKKRWERFDRKNNLGETSFTGELTEKGERENAEVGQGYSGSLFRELLVERREDPSA